MMTNTLIHMMYRCGGNFKTCIDVVLAGVDHFDEISALIKLHHLDEWAVPELLNLPHCYSFDPETGDGYDDELDHPYVSITLTTISEKPSLSLTPVAFIALCKAHNHESYRLPFQR